MNQIQLWFQAKGVELLAAVLIGLAVVAFFGGLSSVSVLLIRTNNIWLQTVGVMVMLAEVAGVVLVLKD
ncbi:hypothetical protein [Ktedonospora formicarum]|uniref:Uncharacterized protein n=1 Tax=Ktedonospora formicarum TaxID=2778364 RepID=A0A8J3I5G3_9CHLR|nr:hypothetical protein [Ktedonospora formicarum]GHO45144.1 hypothetical protein KSX_33070 [Ktedonospora formicarum]